MKFRMFTDFKVLKLMINTLKLLLNKCFKKLKLFHLVIQDSLKKILVDRIEFIEENSKMITMACIEDKGDSKLKNGHLITKIQT